jgi:N-acetyl sugar amidotransferase
MKPEKKYQICTRCLMDTSDPDIAFDDDGGCSHCRAYERNVTSVVVSAAQRSIELEQRIEVIKRDGKGKPYDCIVGVSGGVDSSYVLLLVKQAGLRPLAVHLDNGWDSTIAVENIHRALDRLGIELFTRVLDWEEFRDLQLSFLKASTPDAEIPTDHAIVSTVFQAAWSKGIKHLVLGYNMATEAVLPSAWSQGHGDWKYIRSVQQQFGTKPLRDFPHLNVPDYLRYRYWASRTLNILNYVDYSREQACEVLRKDLGWQDYGGKHHESVYTRFFQAYILPKKFGFDKRRAHLSNQVLSGQITRATALQELAKDPYPSKDLERADRVYVMKKLGLSEAEFEAIMSAPAKRYQDYPNMLQSPVYLQLRGAFRWGRTLLERGRSAFNVQA